MVTRFETATGCEALLAAHGLTDLDAFFAWDQGERLDKPGLAPWRERWRIRLGDHETGDVFYLKRFSHPPLARQIERWRGPHPRLSTGGIEWTNARDLAKAGIPAVEAVAFGQDMRGPWEIRSFVLLREVPGQSLERWVPEHLPSRPEDRNGQTRIERINRLARCIAAFHQAGFAHRDLYLCHVFIHPDQAPDHEDSPGHPETYTLIDLQRVFRPRCRQQRWVIKDLAQLSFSSPADRIGRMDRLRFLCRYVRASGSGQSVRQLARTVGIKTGRIARHQRRRERHRPENDQNRP